MSWGADYAGVDGNKPPHWPDFLRAAGSFVSIRASYVYYDPQHKAYHLSSDPTFERDWQGVPASLPRLAYMFPVPEATQSPEEQVACFVATVNAHGGLRRGKDFPPCLDIEFPRGIAGTGLDRAGVMAWLRRAVAALRAAFGVAPMIYTSGRVWNDDDTDCLGDPPAPDLADCTLWLSRYPYKTRIAAVLPPPAIGSVALPVPTPWGDEWFAWQDQGDAFGVPGFSATADVDTFRVARPGDRGGHVAGYQRRLGLPTTGTYDSALEAAVIAVQRDSGLAQDSVVGPETHCAIVWR